MNEVGWAVVFVFCLYVRVCLSVSCLFLSVGLPDPLHLLPFGVFSFLHLSVFLLPPVCVSLIYGFALCFLSGLFLTTTTIVVLMYEVLCCFIFSFAPLACRTDALFVSLDSDGTGVVCRLLPVRLFRPTRATTGACVCVTTDLSTGVGVGVGTGRSGC